MDYTYMMTMPTLPTQDDSKKTDDWFWLWWLVAFTWIVLGLVAFFWSILCFGKSGGLGYQIVGFLMALFFGPLYWLYFWATKKYCR
jgi:hypothetical protein